MVLYKLTFIGILHLKVTASCLTSVHSKLGFYPVILYLLAIARSHSLYQMLLTDLEMYISHWNTFSAAFVHRELKYPCIAISIFDICNRNGKIRRINSNHLYSLDLTRRQSQLNICGINQVTHKINNYRKFPLHREEYAKGISVYRTK